jgi:tetratricopeptide (TPR) repeat protein
MTPSGRIRAGIIASLPALAAVLVYVPCLGNGFAWDDRQRILESLPLRSLDGELLRWAFTTLSGSYWMPLSWLSLAVDWRLGNGAPWVFHFHNILLHAVNSVLVLYLGRRVLEAGRGQAGARPWEGSAALLAALFFAVHPLHTESVAWAVGRRDLLYAFFFLAAMILHLDRATRPKGKGLRYAACLVLFALSLMSKPMAVTLPLALLVLDFWPLGRLASEGRRALLEKVPFVVMVLPVAWMTMQAPAHTRSSLLVGDLSLLFRTANAFRSVLHYAAKAVIPVGLSPFYPLPRDPDAKWWVVSGLAALVVAAACGAAWRWHRRAPWAVAALAFLLGTLLPVLGLVQAGAHAAADRFLYLPLLAVLLPASVLLGRLGVEKPRFLAALGAALVLVLGGATLRQCAVWKGSVTVFERVLSLHPDVPNFIRANLAAAYAEAGRLEEALREYDRAANIPPARAQAMALAGKAAVLADLGRDAVAERVLREALALDPDCNQARRNLWVLYGRVGRFREALAEIRQAVVLEPRNAENHEKMATVLERTGDWKGAARSLGEWARLSPRDPVPLIRQGVNHLRGGEPAEALASLEAAQRLSPATEGLSELVERARRAAEGGP